jgi:hypothetical protein
MYSKFEISLKFDIYIRLDRYLKFDMCSKFDMSVTRYIYSKFDMYVRD